MFGHLRGAFTGAHYAAMGCFRAADGGTLFLDELGEMDLDLQAKLLRAIQERAVVPVGGDQEVPVDVRLVAATNRDLKREVTEGRFREDLYFRVNVISLETQPLRKRPEDIEILAHRHLATLAVQHGMTFKSLTRDAVRVLESYHWPGNVRELQNVLERAVLFTQGDAIGSDAVRYLEADADAQWVAGPRFSDDVEEPIAVEPIATGQDSADPETAAQWRSMDDVEREHIRETLEHTFFNQSAAARLLERDRQWLLRKIKTYALDVSRSRPGRPTKRHP